MSYRIVITKAHPSFPDEAIIETVECADKKDLDAKFSALNQRRGKDIISIRVKHTDEDDYDIRLPY